MVLRIDRRGDGVETVGGLVEEEHLGLVDECARDHHALAHALGEAVHAVLRAVGETDPAQDLHRVGILDPEERRVEVQVLQRAHVEIEVLLLEAHADLRLDLRVVVPGLPAEDLARPLLGDIWPVSTLIVVDLPAPFGPRKPRISPGITSKLTFFTASMSPYEKLRSSTLMAGVVIAPSFR
jgi:hypothetical protein